MAYQDDFRNKVLQALKAKNLAVDISQEATQQAIVEEAQNVANAESRPMSPEEMKLVLQDVANQLAAENQQFTAQSADFTAYGTQLAGGPGGSYSGGGIAVSVMNKDILIIPTAGSTGNSINTLSQIDFKIISNPNAYGVIDPNEVKSSFYNWGERVSGNTYDTPVLGLGGAWGGVSYTPTSQWGIGGSQGSGFGASINMASGFGQIIYFKPATSTIYASLYNDLGINTDYTNRTFSLFSYNPAVPGSFPTAGVAVTFGGIGNSGDLIIQGSITESQTNTIKFLSPLTITNSTATDTLSLGQSSTGIAVSQWFVGGTGLTPNVYNLATNASSFALGDLFYSAGSGHTTLARLAVVGPNQYLTTVNGVPAWTNTIAANTVSVVAATGSTILYPLLNNIAGAGSAVSTDIDFSVDPGANILRYSSGYFYSGLGVSAPTYTSAGSLTTYTSLARVIIKPGSDFTNAVLVQSSAGATIFNVDTTNSRVGINMIPGSFAFDVTGSANLSSGNSYNINGTQVLSSTQVFGVTVSSSVITGGSWSATAITAHYGGTGLQTPFTIGDLLYANTATTWARLAAATAGSFLVSNGTGAAPQYVSGAGVSVGLVVVTANTVSADNYITFTSGVGGVGLSISNQSQQLTYNPNTQTLRAQNVISTQLTGTLQTASQPNITSASTLATVGTITSGLWQSTAIGTTYGGTGSNLASTGNTNKIIVLGSTANGLAATTIDGATSGYFLMSNANATAPTFSNSSSAAFTFTGGVAFNTIAATTTVTPTGANDLVNKSYADSLSGGLDPHASVRLTTLSAIGGSYRQAGTAGTLDGLGDYIIATTPAALIGTDSGWDTVGIALTNGQRVLVKDGVLGGYASGSGAYSAMSSRTTYGGFANSWIANGIYTVASYGGAATSGWLLVRATDTDNGGGVAELTGGTFTFVEEGTTYADNGFVCTNDTTTLGQIGFGSTQISWSAFSGGAAIVNGQGISKTGNTIATNFNLTGTTLASANLFNGFSIGGARSGSVGSSSYATWVVDGSSVLSTNTFTALGAGFSLAGGQVNRTLTVQGTGNITLDGGGNTLTLSGSSITLTGGGNTLTLSSSSTLNLNTNTLAIASGSNNITFQSGSASGNTAATIQVLVQNGQSQYNLSTANSTMALGDLYYGGQSSVGWTSMTRLALGGTGASVLIRNATNPVWGTIALASSDYVSGTLTTTNGGTSNGSITTTAGQVVYTDGNKFNTTAVGTAGQALLSAGSNAPAFGTLTLAGGGTSNTVSGSGVSYQFAQYNAAGNAISSFGLPTVNYSVLISPSPTTPQWSNGAIGLSYGGTNATSFTNTNGAVIYDGTRLVTATGTTITSGVGVTVNGTVQTTGGFFIGGNSVVTSFAGLYGAVTLSSSASNGGTSFLSISAQNLVINYPGTGITGSATAGQVAYFSAGSTLVGNAAMTFAPAGSGGSSFNLAPSSASATAMYIYAANTSGNILDATVTGSSRFSVDFKGLATHTASSGNTALVVSGGRTILSAASANYAQLNFGNTNANPGSGLSSIGDLWFNGTNLYFQTGATSKFDLLVGSVSGTGTPNKVVKWNTTSSLTDSNISDAGVGMTITSTTSIGAGGGSTAVLTLQTISADNSLTDRYFVRGVTSAGTRLFSIDTAGNLRATTKSFDIPHPTKEGLRLVYGVLEGPEHGVYHRGTAEGKGVIQVNLPDYWHKLVGDQYTIQLTTWGNYNV